MMTNGNTENRLDAVLETEGEARCGEEFEALCRTARQRAVTLLNSEALSYSCFFVLRAHMKTYRLIPLLNARNATAMAVTEHVLSRGAEETGGFPKKNPALIHKTLKWMLQTGGQQEEHAQLRMVTDAAAAVLLHTYRDYDVLKTVCGRIMERAARGYNTHYLLWAYFGSHHPAALRLMSEYLNSAQEAQRETAMRLLGMEREGENAAEKYQRWLEENDGFLYFTDESLQYSGRPEITAVDHERKYLGQKSDAWEKRLAVPADAGEELALAAFRACGSVDREELSGHARKLYTRDPALWSEWIRLPVEEQLRAADLGRGELV